MTLTFNIEYHTHWGENLYVRRGEKSFPMSYLPDGKWTAEISSEEFFGGQPKVEYYYEVLTNGVSTRHEWRAHTLSAKAEGPINDSWSDIPGWKGAGVAVPVFSLRSARDFGVGEFRDLRELVDWAAQTGQSVIQLLPINDTTKGGDGKDSYPYSAVSAFALHPQYIDLEDAGVVPDEAFKALRDSLNALDKIDYERVNDAKNRYLRKLYRESGAAVLRRKAYKDFRKANEQWLLPYACFCALRDEYESSDFSQWGDMAEYTPAKVACYYAANRREVEYYCFVQYHLDRQLREVRDYAHSKGVYLKGDLPIGVGRCSADVWEFPRLFNLDSQAGAPPDYFSEEGQNWGFPTYNWDEMARDGYSWWKRRLGKMNEYFDAFRIDHILGFFRIWEIPMPEKSGAMGHFSPGLPYSLEELRSMGFGDKLDLFLEDPRRKGYYHPRIDCKAALGKLYDEFFFHRHDELWRSKAVGKLSALLGATNMLPCAEDLGMVPQCVRDVMREMNILSLEVLQMPKNEAFPYLSVCTTSTHDTQTLRAWWKENNGGVEPGTDVCRSIISAQLRSPSMLAIFPLQDWLACSEELRYGGPLEDERINIPSICPYNWRYRLHLNLSELLAAKDFNKQIGEMIKASGR